MSILLNDSAVNPNSTLAPAGPAPDLVPMGAKVTLITGYSIMIPIALAGNIFVIRTIFKVPRMRTPTNMMFVNMALFDIIVAVTIMPFSISHILHPYRWIGGLIGTITCKLVFYLFFISIAGSIFALEVMAFDRFFAIVLPFRKVRFFRRYKLLTAIIWIISMVFMLPVPMLQQVTKSNGHYNCFIDWYKLPNPKESYRAFTLCILVVLYFLPLMVMAVLYSLIAHRLWFTRIPGITGNDASTKRAEEKKRRVVKMLIIVLVVFAVCWLPSQIAHFIGFTNVPVQQVFGLFAFWMSHANSAINPCLYVVLHSGFRRAFLQLLRIDGPDENRSHFGTRGTVISSVADNVIMKKNDDQQEALL